MLLIYHNIFIRYGHAALICVIVILDFCYLYWNIIVLCCYLDMWYWNIFILAYVFVPLATGPAVNVKPPAGVVRPATGSAVNVKSPAAFVANGDVCMQSGQVEDAVRAYTTVRLTNA